MRIIPNHDSVRFKWCCTGSMTLTSCITLSDMGTWRSKGVTYELGRKAHDHDGDNQQHDARPDIDFWFGLSEFLLVMLYGFRSY
jgi:hypothetical protein